MFYTFLTQCSATASYQFLYRSDKVFFSFLFKEAFQHYIHEKKKKIKMCNMKQKNMTFLSRTIAHLTDVNRDVSFYGQFCATSYVKLSTALFRHPLLFPARCSAYLCKE